jgi:hypothetical protein
MADSWADSAPVTVQSANGQYRLFITPGRMNHNIEKEVPCLAELSERDSQGSYRKIRIFPLANEEMPVSVRITDDGSRIATIDNWGHTGYGKVVTIYDAHGQQLSSMGLGRIMSKDDVDRYTFASVTSIHWLRGTPYLDEKSRSLILPTKAGGRTVSLDDGSVRSIRIAGDETIDPDQPLQCKGERHELKLTAEVEATLRRLFEREYRLEPGGIIDVSEIFGDACMGGIEGGTFEDTKNLNRITLDRNRNIKVKPDTPNGTVIELRLSLLGKKEIVSKITVIDRGSDRNSQGHK